MSTIANQRSTSVTFVSQNVRGLKSDERLEELFAYVRRRNIVAACIQETWRSGNDFLENGHCCAILSGLDPASVICKRGSQGVGIILSSDGVNAWKAAGSEAHTDLGARVVAIRLLLRDCHNKDVGVFLISAYAPIGTAPDVVWDTYFDQLDQCISRSQPHDILIYHWCNINISIGVENAPLGNTECMNRNYNGPLGKFGLRHINNSGLRFRTYLSINEFVAVTTHFKKRNYGTWQHPRSKLLHQIDHFITQKSMFHRVLDAGITEPILDSDHHAIKCKLRVMSRLKKRSEPRQRLAILDYSKLTDDTVKAQFCKEVINNMEADTSPSTYTKLANAVGNASQKTLSKKQRAQPGWFEENATKLLPLIQARNAAMMEVFKKRTRSKTFKLRAARKALKSALSSAKNSWIQQQCTQLNAVCISHHGTKAAWDTVGKLRSGLSKTRPAPCRKMKRPDGTTCVTPEENAEVFRVHFEKLYGRTATYDASVLDNLPQHPEATEGDHAPTDEDIKFAVGKLRNTGPGDSGICPPAWKALLSSNESFQLLKCIIVDFWETELVPEEWEIGLLKILQKKGDLSQPDNHRGIMLLEVAYKIIAIVLQARLRPIEESLDHETQCGFRPGRGCCDSIFTVKLALKKRREHGLESWVFFLDLVKAFDRVPRELLWQILKKFGVPSKLISILRSLHARVNMKFTVDGVTHIITCIIGVKQGDILGPILFNFFMAAIMISWRIIYDGPLCLFRSKPDYVMTGRSYRARGDEFSLLDSEYADDTAILFESRISLVDGVPLIMSHFALFGMEVHSGNTLQDKLSKSEIIFCSKPAIMYTDPDVYDGADLSDVDLGNSLFIPVVAQFIYLGSMLSRDCSDELDVKARVEKAGNAFGALRRCLFSSTQVTHEAKKMVYEGLILPILLYGAECWCLTEKLYQHLRTFHAQCIRSMCRVTRRHTRIHHISTVQLLKRLCLTSVDVYVVKRQLQWAGHVALMNFHRLPRKMLSAWVPSKRPRGAPRFTYGRGLRKALRIAKIDTETWPHLAQNRDTWRDTIKSLV